MKYILSLDGGGVFGLITLQILKKYSEKYNVSINDRFDLIAGNSTGGIIASMIRAGYSVDNIIDLYTDRSKEIFNRPFAHKLKTAWGLIGPKYASNKKKQLLDEYLFMPFGHTKKLMILSYDILNTEPRFFKNWRDPDSNVFLSDIAHFTSAAPVYFLPVKYDDDYVDATSLTKERHLIDGGLVANNPAVCAYAEAKKLWPNEEIKLLSLGNIADNRKLNVWRWTLLNWATKIPSIFMDGSSDAVHYQLNQICQADPNFSVYKRFEHTGIMGQMDNTDKQYLKDLNTIGMTYATSIADQLVDFC